MAHVMTTDYVGTVCEPLWMFVVCGSKQQRRGVNCATGNHDDVGGITFQHSVALDDDAGDFTPGAICLQLRNSCVCDDGDILILERRVNANSLRVGLGAK